MLFLSPKEFVGVDTSLTLMGESGILYNFYVQVHGFNSKVIPDLKIVVSSAYRPCTKGEISKKCLPFKEEDFPTKVLKKRTVAEKEEGGFMEKVPFSPENLDYGFSMGGDRKIAPQRVFCDGWRTFFDYGDRMGREEIPFIFRVVDGIDTEVNVIRKGNLLIATDTGTFALKLGKKRVCVWKTKP